MRAYRESYASSGKSKIHKRLQRGHRKHRKQVFNHPRVAKKLKDLAVIYYMLHNNFLYTGLAYVCDLEKDFYIVHNNIEVFFIFQKRINTFHVLCFHFLVF